MLEKDTVGHLKDQSNIITEVINPYKAKESKNRKGLKVSGAWSKEIASYIKENDIKALYLNYTWGWTEIDYSFLEQLDTIEELNIIASDAHNFSAIQGMGQLQQLSLSLNIKETIDFTANKKMTKCFLSWWNGASSIFECPWLEDLYLDRTTKYDLSGLGALKKLRKLQVGNSTYDSLAWLPDLADHLIELSLYNCRKITDFTPISSCSKLERLVLSGCKELLKLDFLNKQYKLNVLNISDTGEIESFAPLKELKELKAFACAGKTTIIKDGDLHVLTELPKLAMVMFAPRRHYTHKIIKKWNWNNYDHPDVLLEEK